MMKVGFMVILVLLKIGELCAGPLTKTNHHRKCRMKCKRHDIIGFTTNELVTNVKKTEGILSYETQGSHRKPVNDTEPLVKRQRVTYPTDEDETDDNDDEDDDDDDSDEPSPTKNTDITPPIVNNDENRAIDEYRSLAQSKADEMNDMLKQHYMQTEAMQSQAGLDASVVAPQNQFGNTPPPIPGTITGNFQQPTESVDEQNTGLIRRHGIYNQNMATSGNNVRNFQIDDPRQQSNEQNPQGMMGFSDNPVTQPNGENGIMGNNFQNNLFTQPNVGNGVESSANNFLQSNGRSTNADTNSDVSEENGDENEEEDSDDNAEEATTDNPIMNDPSMMAEVSKWQDSIDPLVSKIYKETAMEGNLKQALAESKKYLPRINPRVNHDSRRKQMIHQHRDALHKGFTSLLHAKDGLSSTDIPSDYMKKLQQMNLYEEPSTSSYMKNKNEKMKQSSGGGISKEGFVGSLYHNLLEEDENIIAQTKSMKKPKGVIRKVETHEALKQKDKTHEALKQKDGIHEATKQKDRAMEATKQKDEGHEAPKQKDGTTEVPKQEKGKKDKSVKKKLNLAEVLNILGPSSKNDDNRVSTTRHNIHMLHIADNDTGEEMESSGSNGVTIDAPHLRKESNDHEAVTRAKSEISGDGESILHSATDSLSTMNEWSFSGDGYRGNLHVTEKKINHSNPPKHLKSKSNVNPHMNKEKTDKSDSESNSKLSSKDKMPHKKARHSETTKVEKVSIKESQAPKIELVTKLNESQISDPTAIANALKQENQTSTKKQVHYKGFTIVGNKGDDNLVVAITVSKQSNHSNDSTHRGFSALDNKAIGNVITSMINSVALNDEDVAVSHDSTVTRDTTVGNLTENVLKEVRPTNKSATNGSATEPTHLAPFNSTEKIKIDELPLKNNSVTEIKEKADSDEDIRIENLLRAHLNERIKSEKLGASETAPQPKVTHSSEKIRIEELLKAQSNENIKSIAELPKSESVPEIKEHSSEVKEHSPGNIKVEESPKRPSASVLNENSTKNIDIEELPKSESIAELKENSTENDKIEKLVNGPSAPELKEHSTENEIEEFKSTPAPELKAYSTENIKVEELPPEKIKIEELPKSASAPEEIKIEKIQKNATALELKAHSTEKIKIHELPKSEYEIGLKAHSTEDSMTSSSEPELKMHSTEKINIEELPTFGSSQKVHQSEKNSADDSSTSDTSTVKDSKDDSFGPESEAKEKVSTEEYLSNTSPDKEVEKPVHSDNFIQISDNSTNTDDDLIEKVSDDATISKCLHNITCRKAVLNKFTDDADIKNMLFDELDPNKDDFIESNSTKVDSSDKSDGSGQDDSMAELEAKGFFVVKKQHIGDVKKRGVVKGVKKSQGVRADTKEKIIIDKQISKNLRKIDEILKKFSSPMQFL